MFPELVDFSRLAHTFSKDEEDLAFHGGPKTVDDKPGYESDDGAR